ncbi:hypothetical protein J4204_04180 [Candidatus Woesearchaeota archaeon]|nr:hypothetical protein [Candidatus Woesearchaeota archaeon]
MRLLQYLWKSLKIIFFNFKIIDEIKEDKKATKYGLALLIFNTIIFRIADIVDKKLNFLQSLTRVILEDVLLTILFLMAIHLVARMLKSKEEFIKFFRVFASTSIFSLIFLLKYLPYNNLFNSQLIPIVEGLYIFIVFVWAIIITFFLIKKPYKLSTSKTLLGMLFSLILLAIISFIIMIIEVQSRVFTFNEIFPTLNATNYSHYYSDQDLIVKRLSFGFLSGNKCFSSKNNIYYQNISTPCVVPHEISGLQLSKDDWIIYNMDYKMLNSNGDIVKVEKEIFGSDGDNAFQDSFDEYNGFNYISIDSKDLSPDNYTIELTFFDMTSKKFAKISASFVILPKSEFK